MNERLATLDGTLPEGVAPEMGPIATGLGEVYMWPVRLDHRADDRHGFHRRPRQL
ncbi:Cu/Ag efflux pump CusA [Novosphingobium gossypii]